MCGGGGGRFGGGVGVRVDVIKKFFVKIKKKFLGGGGGVGLGVRLDVNSKNSKKKYFFFFGGGGGREGGGSGWIRTKN